MSDVVRGRRARASMLSNSFQLDFGATPRDEIHLLCLLIKHKPMKLTSGYCFTRDVEWMIFFPGK